MTKQTAERYALAAAGGVIVALTVGGFWLSYAHLAEVAGNHGLRGSPARRWAWPATLDAFIVAGELLMLRAGLRRVTDRWAIALTGVGSVGSIALNVAGVSGTGDAGAVPMLDYVVAAVPPTAALLAFGVLMRQIHQLVAEPAARQDSTPDRRPGRWRTLPFSDRNPTTGFRRARHAGADRRAPPSTNSWRSAASPSPRNAPSPGQSSNSPYGTRDFRSAVSD